MSIELTDEFKERLRDELIGIVSRYDRGLMPRSENAVIRSRIEKDMQRVHMTDQRLQDRVEFMHDSLMGVLGRESDIRESSDLKCEHPEYGDDALEAFHESDESRRHDGTHTPDIYDVCLDGARYNWNFEHGQLWIRCICGACWSVVDAEGGPAIDGFYFERVSDGESELYRDNDDGEDMT